MTEHTDPRPTRPGPPEVDPQARARANKAAAVYGLYRLVLFIVLTVVIQGLAVLIGAPVPLIMSALLALLVAFPLSMLIFTKQRVEATQALAAWKEQRAARKEWIQSELAER
ncbi:DUF4229 domain-containing protein [Corynebacterium sp. TA-R-1]|uniref:DUF4229 domain-containing protein n=1 Tax=Corynebacterium stercoris TaxID=2943490 RepID=A0ABT1G205_9CORY|nr:DUF4229 domain-containing protein [Corynebacterium stercoris]